MHSLFMFGVLASLGLADAFPSPAKDTSPSNLSLRDEFTFEVFLYDGSCIPENQVRHYYGFDIESGSCVSSDLPGSGPTGQSARFVMPEGYTAQLFTSRDCSEQVTEIGSNQCFTSTQDKMIGAWIVNTHK